MTNKDIESARRTIDKEVDALRIMESELDLQPDRSSGYDTGRQRTRHRNRNGKIGAYRQQNRRHLASTGTPFLLCTSGRSQSRRPPERWTDDDVVLAISNGGESKELSDILIYCKRYGIPLISMTKNPDSTLGKPAISFYVCPDAGEACPLGMAPTSSTTATLVLGDIPAIALMERKGLFEKQVINNAIRGGKLGALLQKFPT